MKQLKQASATAAIAEPQTEQPSVEDAEAEYIKSRSNSAKNTVSPASSTTKGTAWGNRASGA